MSNLQEKQCLRLGLDVGLNSIGWALTQCKLEERIDESSGELSIMAGEALDLLALGSHIFPVGVAEDKYAKNASEESKNIKRRMTRMARRLNHRYKQRRAKLMRLLLENDMMPPPGWQHVEAPKLWGLRARALDEQITPTELGRILLHLNQRRGFRSTRQEEASSTDDKEKGAVKLGMAETENAVREAGARTLGEYGYMLFKQAGSDPDSNPYEALDEKGNTIRRRFVPRSLYEREFDLIWEQQARHHPTLLSDELKRRLRDETIFMQRPLKSAKHLVGKCTLEPRKRTIPLSAPLFQEFRIWQTLANVKLLLPGAADYRFLTLDEKHKLATELRFEEKLTDKEIKKLLRFEGREVRFNDVKGFGKGNRTLAALAKAIGEEDRALFDQQDFERLWHTLYSSSTTVEEFIDHLVKRHNLKLDQADKVARIQLEDGYGSLSSKAISKILPLMQEGMNYPEAASASGYHHSQRDIDDSNRALDDKLILDPRKGRIQNVKSPLVAKALTETYRLVNYLIARYGRPHEIVVELARDLQKTKEEREKTTKSLKEAEERRDVYRAFLKERFPGMRVNLTVLKKFELFLQLYYANPGATGLEQVSVADYISASKNIKVKDSHRYSLWMEANRRCPYTGKSIALSDLYTGAFEIEHIYPYSLSSDDSIANKTLCCQQFNKEAGNYHSKSLYIKTLGQDKWQAFAERIKCLPYGKQQRLLAEELPEGFKEKQLTLSRWAARQLRDSMKTIARNVRTSPGQVTAILRRTWAMEDNIFGRTVKGKDRYDHRHHAIDALVLACTRQGDVQRLSTLAGKEALRAGDVRIKGADFPAPPALRYEKVQQAVAGILVSYRKENRLIVPRTNLYRWHRGNRENGQYKRNHVQTTMTVRGPLHEETLYGRIQNPHTGETSYVVRKALRDLKYKQLEGIVDPAVRKAVKDYIDNNGGEGKIKELFAKPVMLQLKPGGKYTRIESVRWDSGATSNLPEIRPGTFVEPGNNYLMAIYAGVNQKGKEKRKALTISFMEAVERARQEAPLYPATHEGLPLWMTLQQNDLLVIDISTREELEALSRQEIFERLYRVKKMSGASIGLIRHHWSIGNPDYSKGDPSKGLHYTKEDSVAFMKSAGALVAVKVNLKPDGTLTYTPV